MQHPNGGDLPNSPAGTSSEVQGLCQALIKVSFPQCDRTIEKIILYDNSAGLIGFNMVDVAIFEGALREGELFSF